MTESFWNEFSGWYNPRLTLDDSITQSAGNLVQEVRKAVGKRDFWQVSESELSAIYIATALLKPGNVVETGVGPGTTSFAFLSAIGNSGNLYSFDLGVKYGQEKAELPVGFVVPERVKKNWHLTIGNSRETLLPKLREIGSVNIFFHDSEHTYDHVTLELDSVLPYLRGNWIIMVDNFDWTDAPHDFAERNKFSLVRVVDDLCFIHS
ncbi:MAG: class I SAM-dependent methyltransferase [Candidatus Thermoplasmatota archaeon]|nr:class I SAM-dependent methyltransferase [Candidatus Thermoplasmatota archaeon]